MAFQALAGAKVGICRCKSFGQLMGQLQDGNAKLFSVVRAAVLHRANLGIRRRTSTQQGGALSHAALQSKDAPTCASLPRDGSGRQRGHVHRKRVVAVVVVGGLRIDDH
jgi:hypothetical protein